ncbi:DUF6934 family protein [Sediminibacterium ginsengisoli]|uniref:Uncharacterized protein n=1 Tax=Sediminibacterium ginsengisoli TaxID=413434 RepID=A0A1T4RFZ2_9BACT|nr:hypothetical protein [Sediminibacterium ginsengisoli]SKA14950.1 hypothetical protein SAMN04488132_11236 [Sediminibacterium ginsengisoli]
MKQELYTYTRETYVSYSFISKGKKDQLITVEFVAAVVPDIFHLAFGFHLPAGHVNELAGTVNGDWLKVMITVMDIVEAFITENPDALVVFYGETHVQVERYMRMLKTHALLFNPAFCAYVLPHGQPDTLLSFETAPYRENVLFVIKAKANAET